MSIILHFIDKNWKLQKRILHFCQVIDHKEDTIGIAIKVSILDWSIEFFFTITMDNACVNNGAISYLKRNYLI